MGGPTIQGTFISMVLAYEKSPTDCIQEYLTQCSLHTIITNISETHNDRYVCVDISGTLYRMHGFDATHLNHGCGKMLFVWATAVVAFNANPLIVL